MTSSKLAYDCVKQFLEPWKHLEEILHQVQSHTVAVLVFLNMFLHANDSMKISPSSSKNTGESFCRLFLELLAAICANTILRKNTLGGPCIFFFGKLGKIHLLEFGGFQQFSSKTTRFHPRFHPKITRFHRSTQLPTKSSLGIWWIGDAFFPHLKCYTRLAQSTSELPQPSSDVGTTWGSPGMNQRESPSTLEFCEVSSSWNVVKCKLITLHSFSSHITSWKFPTSKSTCVHPSKAET